MKKEFKLIAHFPNLKEGKTKTKAKGIIENDRIVSWESPKDAVDLYWIMKKSWSEFCRDYFLEKRFYEVRERVLREEENKIK